MNIDILLKHYFNKSRLRTRRTNPFQRHSRQQKQEEGEADEGGSYSDDHFSNAVSEKSRNKSRLLSNLQSSCDFEK